MVQLGLCAFRQGLIYEAHTALHDIWASGHFRELLAQGISYQRGIEKTQEQESAERKRQVCLCLNPCSAFLDVLI